MYHTPVWISYELPIQLKALRDSLLEKLSSRIHLPVPPVFFFRQNKQVVTASPTGPSPFDAESNASPFDVGRPKGFEKSNKHEHLGGGLNDFLTFIPI